MAGSCLFEKVFTIQDTRTSKSHSVFLLFGAGFHVCSTHVVPLQPYFTLLVGVGGVSAFPVGWVVICVLIAFQFVRVVVRVCSCVRLCLFVGVVSVLLVGVCVHIQL